MPKKPQQDSAEKSPLKTAAIAIGELAGKAVAAAESVLPHKHAAPPAGKARKASGKLPPKNKARVPRRLKKRLAKQAR